MIVRKVPVLLLLWCLPFLKGWSQASMANCPANIGFEFGNFINWQTNIGSTSVSGTTNVITLSPTTWLDNAGTTGHQQLMDRNTSPAADAYGKFPVNPVNGGRYSLKLGSDGDDGTCSNNQPCPNAKAEAARYIVNVPTNATNYSITFSYAVVLENPLDAVSKHKEEEQPRFRVRMYDPQTNEVIPCADFGFVASGPLPGFDTASFRKHNDAVVKYKSWSSVYVNLSKYAGRTFYLEFTTADCTKGGHFGYAYVDVIECGVAAKSLYRCSAPHATTLVGPPGFEKYQWYNADFSRLLGTTQDYVLNPGPLLGTRFWVVATPYTNTGCLTCDCRDTVEVIVSVTYPTAVAGSDVMACPGKPVTLGAAAEPGYTYQWLPAANLSSPNAASTQATVSVPSTYVLTVTDTLTCTDTDTVSIRIYDPISLQATDREVCANNAVTLHASGASTYLWTPSTGLSSATVANPVVRPSATTVYTVVGTDSVACYSDTAKVTVTVLPQPTVSLGPDLSLPAGDLVTLNNTVTAGPIVRWLWTPAANLNCNTCPTPVAEVKQDITYRLQVTNSNGCTGADSITIRALCKDGQVYIPNAFTPDGDGVNDVFMIQGRGIYVVKSFRIFNRWGELIFERQNISPNDPRSGWDGKIRGIASGPDVFVYTAEVVCGSGSVYSFKGNVSVLK